MISDMGWRTAKVYQEAERAEWRRFMAEQPPLRRLYIRAYRAAFIWVVLLLLSGPPAAITIRGLL
jgi:hypothetical protein